MKKVIEIIAGITGIIIAATGFYYTYLYVSSVTVEGTIRDGENNRPISGVSVSIKNNNKLTGDDGMFLFEKIRPGNYEISARKAGYKDYSGVIKVKEDTVSDFAMSLIKPKKESTRETTDDELRLKINAPKDGVSVGQKIVAEGEASGKIKQGGHLWLVVHPIGTSGWWPQDSEFFLNGTKWTSDVTLGEASGSNRQFEIVVFLVNEEGHKSFVEYIEKSKRAGDFPETPLPSGVEKLAGVTVNRN